MKDDISGPYLGRLGWLAHRIFASYWLLPAAGVLLALPLAILAVTLDRHAGTDWLLSNGLSPVSTADTAKDLVGVAIGVNAAFITLYFSLTLLVLTVASSNLGVRLVDRWLDKGLVRVSLAGLSFTLVFSLGAMAAIDADAPLSSQPLGTISAVIALQALNVVMLTVALHDLGRTVFIDRSIHHLGREAAQGPVAIAATDPFHGDWSLGIAAPREGYVEGNNLHHLSRLLGEDGGRVRICAAPGQHVMEGEPIMLLEQRRDDERQLLKVLPIGDFRSDGQGAVFRIRLLVEIAARALSPAVNDFYTAIAAADRIASAMAGQFGSWVDEDMMPAFADDHRIELPGQDFRGLFEDPLNAFRQAACQYPSVTIRMVDNYHRLIDRCEGEGRPAGLRRFLVQMAQDLAEHGEASAGYDCDRADITAAFKKIAGPEGRRRANAA
ncbi:DUF2254 family protein [Paraurantiacibacter namhicola]|uniref:DUF2254 domain-containing protein n=1 Tax=Paraurantiacibacter namhicola TaxID=645517 RepID=A0A1C7DBF4_9SPHN|nr:DUF2254 family protein [Paraurantiacibacter namhicola]ANU08747.1 hypothetical protein A6F65_02466 [Paraurantiacibacter namhicola]